MTYVGSRRNRRMAVLAGAIAVTLCSGIAAAGPNSTSLILEASRTLGNGAALVSAFPEKRSIGPRNTSVARYTVVFKEAPLASYDGRTTSYAAAPRDQKGRLQVRSPEAVSYVNHLQDKQNNFLSEIGSQFGRPMTALMQFQHAINGVVLELSADEAEQLRQRPDVMMVDIEKMQPLLTDRGPAFIGADKIWDGTATGGLASQGEGIVIGDIDSGINFTSPSFADVGPKDAYHNVNPLGAGNYLGLCQVGQVDENHCNAKLIGLYDFVNSVCIGAGNPCGAAGTWTEEPSATDSNGHGSHTASTAVGNHADVSLSGGNFTISGVAPHASIIAYDACYTRNSDGGGLCPTTSTTASVNRAVADGIVDVLTFSIGGGTSPWTDTTSLAFLNAQNAGIFVVAAAGNDGPAASTVSHVEPWVATAAASTHDRILGYNFSLTSPGAPPPANTVNLPVRPGGNPQPTANLVSLPIKESPNFANGSTDGCTAYPAHTFDRDVTSDESIFADGFEGTPPAAIVQKGIAVLHLNGTASSCGSGARRTNALAAGAAAVIFVDTAYLNLGAADTSYAMTLAQWTDVSTQINTDPTHAKASVTLPLQSFLSGQGDVVADFSSRGPAAGIGGQAIVKPEISAPGVAILAAYMGAPGSVAIEDGTSMSTPHIAGAAALLRSIHPTWSPMQIRSAMMTTAKTAGVVKQDNTPAGVWDRGAGRIDLVGATKAGLVFDETGANFTAANPSLPGGKISTLNLPSIAESSCTGTCTFTRTVRNTHAGALTYNVAVTGLSAGAGSVLPTSFTIPTNGSKTFVVSVIGSMLTPAAYEFGEITLTPTDPSVPVQHMPVAIRQPGPLIQLSTNSLTSAGSTGGPTTTQPLVITNIGNPTLNWSVGTGTGPYNLLVSPATPSGNGEGFGKFTVAANSFYGAQNFDVPAQVHMTNLRANGFLFPSGVLNATNTSAVTFSIYNDAPGVPTGGPDGFGNPAVWTYSGTTTGSGISVVGTPATSSDLSLNLNAAGVPALDLPIGRYWFVAYPTMNSTGVYTAANPGWAWRTSDNAPVGNPTKYIQPAAPSPAWVNLDDGEDLMSVSVQGNVDCTKPSWVSYAPTSGSLGTNATSNVTVTFDPTGLNPGSYSGALCITSNATNTPTAVAILNYTVTGAPVVTKAFSPTSVAISAPSTLTITLSNGNATQATLSSSLTDTLPANLVASAGTAATTCTGGTGASIGGGGGSVVLGAGAKIPASGSCTVTATVTSSTAATYNNTIAVGALATDQGNSAAAANASLTVNPPFTAPGLSASFAPNTSVAAGSPSTLKLTLTNSNGTAATLTADLVDTLPAGVVVAGTPNASTTCGGAVTNDTGSVTLAAAGSSIPANGSCTVSIDVQSATAGAYTNTVPAGALVTSVGTSATAASDNLVVTGTFPAPYCAVTASQSIEPITLVDFAGINNTSLSTLGSGGALTNYLTVTGGAAAPRGGYTMTVKGNTDGNFQTFIRTYFDWNHDGVFATDGSESADIGSITNSTGNDAIQASSLVIVPPTAKAGLTRMRVTKTYGSYGDACGDNSYGQAEDYLVNVDTSLVPPATPALLSSTFTPNFLSAAGQITTLKLVLTNYNATALALTAALTDTLPAGLVVATPANSQTTCIGGTVTGAPGDGSFSLNSGAQIPGDGTCFVSIDLTAAVGGIYVNNLPVGAAQTANGNSPTASSATVQFATPTPTYSTGFEAPFTVAALNAQQGWAAQGTTAPAVVTTTPANGTQVARMTSKSSTSTTGQPLILSPVSPKGTSPYSSLSANLRISRTTNGASWEFDPQDSSQGLVSVKMQFDRAATRNIQILNFNTSAYTVIGTWDIDTYANIRVVVERATGTLDVCKGATTLLHDTSGDYLAGENITDLAVLQVLSAGTTVNNTILVDDVVVDNPATWGGCGSPRPAERSLTSVTPEPGSNLSKQAIRQGKDN
jgi:hypothetical protein